MQRTAAERSRAQIQILGEAARHVSEEVKAEHPEVPWPDITGIRHRIVHDYANVNPRMVWVVVQLDLPALRPQFASILSSLEPDPHAS